VGIKLTGKGFPRPGYRILADGEDVGVLTSGTVSPSLGVGVAMGFVEASRAKAGTALQVDIRGRVVDAVVQRPPFYTDGTIRR
jgi:aminomethyltransferase